MAKQAIRRREASAGELRDLAREENDLIKKRFLQTMAQIVCIPHVKFHALWASDFAVTLINRIHPGDLDAVGKERQIQIELLENIL
ncbi:MAG: hypothetical protein LBJ12_08960 [Oscillospiraceae bacterium]|jgi:hypothetical protein|nr:hypothetical protein [Oscillospiraceae bacterium]